MCESQIMRLNNERQREVAKISKKEDRSKEEWHPSAKDQESAAKVLFLCSFCLEWHDEMLE